jgi:hypothetical protein
MFLIGKQMDRSLLGGVKIIFGKSHDRKYGVKQY